ncbi:phosphoribosylamine--glycine ligase [bacterium]|nr:phosphoribosylamine--glycine ligase [bacterium]
MRIVVIGSGGREHALLWKFQQSPIAPKLFALPGNAGMAGLCELVPTSMEVDDLISRIAEIGPDLVVVGPEQPLAMGLTDRVESLGFRCFGPSASAARLESSKIFAKRLMRSQNIPTADFEVFDDFYELSDYIQAHPKSDGRVVKADGLAAGKGAFVCASDQEALEIAHQLLVDKVLGEPGLRVVVEEKLYGREASLQFLCDGERFVALPPVQDYKRAFDNDEGPNTGGMGTFCPATHITEEILYDVERRVVSPVLRAMAAQGTPYRGLLYVGLMLTELGAQVIEFNCRFGDPETQVLLPCLEFDLVSAIVSCVDGTLRPQDYTHVAKNAAVCVVICANGYPGEYSRKIPLKRPVLNEGQVLLSAGTALDDGRWISSGGRVLNALGTGATIADARFNAYELAERACVPGLRYRRDIALVEAV